MINRISLLEILLPFPISERRAFSLNQRVGFITGFMTDCRGTTKQLNISS